jgi:hypothetical protein
MSTDQRGARRLVPDLNDELVCVLAQVKEILLDAVGVEVRPGRAGRAARPRSPSGEHCSRSWSTCPGC